MSIKSVALKGTESPVVEPLVAAAPIVQVAAEEAPLIRSVNTSPLPPGAPGTWQKKEVKCPAAGMGVSTDASLRVLTIPTALKLKYWLLLVLAPPKNIPAPPATPCEPCEPVAPVGPCEPVAPACASNAHLVG